MTRQLVSLAALALTLAACGGGGDTTEPTPTPVAGTYPLRSYNGATLPIVVAQNATQGTLEITTGYVALRDDGSFNESMTFRLTPPGPGSPAATVDSLTSRGRYTTNAARAQITFTFPDGEVVTAGFADGTITVTGQATFVYRR